MYKIIISLFLSGLLFGSGPCMATCGPVLIAYVTGRRKNVFKSLVAYLLFSLSRIAVYLLLGLAVFLFGKFTIERLLGGFSKYLVFSGGLFLIVIGILIAGGRKWDFNFCRLLQQHILERDKKSVVFLGMIMGILPCAPLLAILSYVGLVSKTWTASLLYSLSFGLGTVVSPLVAVTAMAGLIPRLWREEDRVSSRIFGLICGLVLIILGAQWVRRAF